MLWRCCLGISQSYWPRVLRYIITKIFVWPPANLETYLANTYFLWTLVQEIRQVGFCSIHGELPSPPPCSSWFLLIADSHDRLTSRSSLDWHFLLPPAGLQYSALHAGRSAVIPMMCSTNWNLVPALVVLWSPVLRKENSKSVCMCVFVASRMICCKNVRNVFLVCKHDWAWLLYWHALWWTGRCILMKTETWPMNSMLRCTHHEALSCDGNLWNDCGRRSAALPSLFILRICTLCLISWLSWKVR